jgi:hypothetical protein
MAGAGGSDIIFLMVAGVTMVILTIRIAVRAHRIKHQAWRDQAKVPVRRPAERNDATATLLHESAAEAS